MCIPAGIQRLISRFVIASIWRLRPNVKELEDVLLMQLVTLGEKAGATADGHRLSSMGFHIIRRGMRIRSFGNWGSVVLTMIGTSSCGADLPLQIIG